VTLPDAVLDSVAAELRTSGHIVRRLGGYRLEFETRRPKRRPASRGMADPLLVSGGSILLDPAGRLHVELHYSPAMLLWLFGLAAVVVALPLPVAVRACILAVLAWIVAFNAWWASGTYVRRISDAAFSARQPARAGRQP
jgi:hypothetical protein